MWKKISIQLILLSIVFFSFFYVYKYYFKTKDNIKIDQSDIVQNNSSGDINNNKSDFDIDNQDNLIKNLSYFSKDNLGNEYIIESKYSELNLDNVDIINMKKVSAKIIMVNSKPIYITSDFAKYNNANYETTFTDNVIYENPKGKLIADTIEIDLITKNTRIFMVDKNKKVMVINK